MRKYPQRPWVGIGVVVHKGEDILLIKRGKAPNLGAWSLPGGAQSLGETVFEAALREVREETSIIAHSPYLIDVVDSIHKDEHGEIEYHYTLIEVGCSYLSGTPIAGDDAKEAQWAPFTNIEDFKLMDKTIEIIKSSYLSRNASLTDE